MNIGGIDVFATVKATARDFLDDDLQGAAAEVAYNFIFAIVPLLIFLTALSAAIGRALSAGANTADVTDWLFHGSGLPRQTAAALQGPIENVIQTESGGILSIGLVLAIWGAKNGVASLMKALDVAFDVQETRPWWKATAISLALTIGVGLAVALASLLLILGNQLGAAIARLFGLGAAWGAAWDIVRIVLIPALLIVGLAVFYWAAPNVDAPFKWLTPGSILAVVLWIAASLLLQFYFRYAAGYVTAYGILGGMLAFIFWFYVMALILLLGGELNSVLARAHSPQTQAQIAASQRPGAELGGSARDEPNAAGSPSPRPSSDRDESRAAASPRTNRLLGYAVIALAALRGLRRRSDG
ncbi:MAG TPA: YihY/virulence factor BrkB family protein [Thermomicrobiales bacterium]|nr:YihY/virulence factor BrkB family protein [Thermomicrobiales bacterium]